MQMTYMRNGEAHTQEFDSVAEMVMFVIQNDVKDEEFVSMDAGMVVVTGGIHGLKEALYQVAEHMVEEENEWEDEEEEYVC